MKIAINKKKKCKPFLRWTGSKTWLIKQGFEDLIPQEYNNYHECFLGGGAAFFNLLPKEHSFLYDYNSELIETYIEIRDNVEELILMLGNFENSEEKYYEIRRTKYDNSLKRSARFIYLNKCSFNGIYRVNSKGEYNVPYGKRNKVDIICENNLRLVSKGLKNTTLRDSDFFSALEHINEGDLIFLDPPYTVAHENNGFIEYNQKLFSWEVQERLKGFVEEIIKKKAYFILTNASHHSILKLYEDVESTIMTKSRYSKIGGRVKTRGMYNELIICNTI